MGRLRSRNLGLAPSSTGGFLAALVLIFSPLLSLAQETPDIAVLEPEYRQANLEYQAAFNALVAMEGRFNQALEDLDVARAAGDEARSERALSLVMQLSGEQRELTLRLNEKAGALQVARSQLIRAQRQRVDELIAEGDSAQTREEREASVALLEDANLRLLELLGEEEPETALEAMRDITISRTDSPGDILRKAATLELRADQHEARLQANDRRLEELQQDLRRSRRVSDFLSDMERFGDNRLPVGSPGAQTTPPPGPGELPPGADSLGVTTRPMTLEERIRSLEILRVELEERIQLIRDKAARFRELARGEVAA